MGAITLPNFRTTADVRMNTRLKDGGMYIDWTGLSDIKVWLWSESQKAIAGRCDVEIDEADSTKLVCRYSASKPQYLGLNKIIVQATYMGGTKTYDKTVFNFVRWTADQSGTQITIDDPDVDVEIVAEDISSSIINEAVRAALDAADEALAAKAAVEATEADVEAAEAARVTAESARETAEEVRVAQAAADHTQAVADHTQAGQDHTAIENAISAAEAAVGAAVTAAEEAVDAAVSDAEDAAAAAVAAAGQADAKAALVQQRLDTADADHTRAEADHTQAGADHTLAGTDHETAAADHTQAGTDHSTAAADHTAAASDHTRAGQDHTQAAADHTQAGDDHTQAKADHAVMAGYDNRLSAVEGDVTELEANVNDLFQDQDGETLYICDPFGHIIAKIDADGIHATEMEAGDLKMSDLKAAKEISTLYDKDLYITDANGNVIFQLNKDGILATAIRARNVMKNPWGGKVLATYGDSITASTGGDFDYPYDQQLVGKWGNIVGKYFDFAKHHGRGIGSTCAIYRPSGGQVAWCKTDTGVYVGRNDSYTYDNYTGTIPDGCTKVRGDGSSWLRITTMFPASIKDTIDTVLVMFHNDYHQDTDTDVLWVNGSTTDPEWAASSQYQTLGGDYNIADSVKAGFASIVMKLQAWMPQARIVLMTPISGVYASSGAVDGNFDNTQAALMLKLAKCVKDVAERMSIPCIDNYGNDGINSLNRTAFISDNIHPNNDGNLRIAQSVIGGLSRIIPNLTY